MTAKYLYLGLGTNLGDKVANMHWAINEIRSRIGRIAVISDFYITSPWGFQSSNMFLNAVIAVETSLSPESLLAITKDIESGMGRKNKSFGGVYSDRLIDIDLLLYGDTVIKTSFLTLPHPLMLERRFVMEPFVEIASTIVHPLSGKTILQLYNELDGTT